MHALCTQPLHSVLITNNFTTNSPALSASVTWKGLRPTTKTALYWHVTPCIMLGIFSTFRRKLFHPLSGFYPSGGSRKFLENVNTFSTAGHDVTPRVTPILRVRLVNLTASVYTSYPVLQTIPFLRNL